MSTSAERKSEHEELLTSSRSAPAPTNNSPTHFENVRRRSQPTTSKETDGQQSHEPIEHHPHAAGGSRFKVHCWPYVQHLLYLLLLWSVLIILFFPILLLLQKVYVRPMYAAKDGFNRIPRLYWSPQLNQHGLNWPPNITSEYVEEMRNIVYRNGELDETHPGNPYKNLDYGPCSVYVNGSKTYDDSAPPPLCVMFRLNKIYDFVPADATSDGLSTFINCTGNGYTRQFPLDGVNFTAFEGGTYFPPTIFLLIDDTMSQKMNCTSPYYFPPPNEKPLLQISFPDHNQRVIQRTEKPTATQLTTKKPSVATTARKETTTKKAATTAEATDAVKATTPSKATSQQKPSTTTSKHPVI